MCQFSETDLCRNLLPSSPFSRSCDIIQECINKGFWLTFFFYSNKYIFSVLPSPFPLVTTVYLMTLSDVDIRKPDAAVLHAGFVHKEWVWKRSWGSWQLIVGRGGGVFLSTGICKNPQNSSYSQAAKSLVAVAGALQSCLPLLSLFLALEAVRFTSAAQRRYMNG